MTTNSINYQMALSNIRLNESKVRVHVATALQQEAEAARVLTLTPYEAELAANKVRISDFESSLAQAKKQYADRYAAADITSTEAAAKEAHYAGEYAQESEKYI